MLLPVMVITTVIAILISVVSGLTGGKTRVNRSRAEVSEIIDDFVNGTGQSDFGQFLYVAIQDPQLDSVRMRCLQLHEEYPPEEEGYWCSRAVRVPPFDFSMYGPGSAERNAPFNTPIVNSSAHVQSWRAGHWVDFSGKKCVI